MEAKNFWKVTLKGLDESTKDIYVPGDFVDQVNDNAKKVIKEIDHVGNFTIDSIGHIGKIYL